VAEREIPPREITNLLHAWRQGDSAARERLLALVYDDLRRRASRQLARSPSDRVLDTTGLVHEAYMRMVQAGSLDWRDRNHFFGVAVKAMRSVAVDYARRGLAGKRGGAARPILLDEGLLRVEQDAAEILAVHQALERLVGLDPRLAELVELRFFGGLTFEEAGEVLGVSARTVMRDWAKARTLLFGMLSEA
jgi:RNA polymerase sigma factor (TIGR02999 family)